MPNAGRTLAGALVATTTLVLGIVPTAGAGAVDDATLTPRTDFVVQPLRPDGSTPPPPANGEKIPNIDSVKATVRTYYGATGTGIAHKTSSPYISEITALQQDVLDALPDPAPRPDLAVVLDVDDTLLWTYDMVDAAMHFHVDPEVRDEEWVQPGRFPAVPGMVDFVAEVSDRGYDVYALSERSPAQEEATLANLAAAGYAGFTRDTVLTGSRAAQSLVELKAGLRAGLEAQGTTIVLNVGDQYADLLGGNAEETVKLPNPTYYRPSPNIEGAPTSDADLVLPTEFEMAANGASGRTTPGDRIPNVDNVLAEIRAYYGAVNGIADQQSSPYLTQMTAFAKRWKQKLTDVCARGMRKGLRPAVVFDADDTTLMTYDMEDAAMEFNYSTTLQNVWVQESRFPATPRMPGVVAAAAKAGCTIVGLTGRNNAQRVATLDNLARWYHDARGNPYFRSAHYFTKWTSSDTPPAHVDCTVDGNPAGCSSLDFKASTRRLLQERGMRIVANFGDQFSDLIGGSSARPVKLPNPTYYLP